MATKLGIHSDAARKRKNNLGRTLKPPQPPKKAAYFEQIDKNPTDQKDTSKIRAALESLPQTKTYDSHTYAKNKISIEARSAYYYCSCKCSLIVTINKDNETVVKCKGEHSPLCPTIHFDSKDREFEIELHQKLYELCQNETTFRSCFDQLFKWFKEKVGIDEENQYKWQFF